MLLGTVRRKLAALVAFSALAAAVVLPMLWWLMHRELIDEVDDRVPEAIHGFEEELGDDIKDLDVTARALSQQLSAWHFDLSAFGRDPVATFEQLAAPFRAAYPDLDIVLYGPDGKLVAQIGCASPQPTVPRSTGGDHVILPHGCETADLAPVAIGIVVSFGIREPGPDGFLLVCLPLDKAYFANARKKLGGELALERESGGMHSLLISTPGFPVEHLDDATQAGSIHDEGSETWAIAWFHAAPLAKVSGGLRFSAALDVTDIKRIVRKHLLLAFAIVLLATSLSMAVGWRLATRMGTALGRVSHAMARLEQQDYVKVDPVRTGDELEDLANGFNEMVEGLQERDKLRSTMGKYMTAEIVEHLMAGQVELGGKTLELTILFCDLRDFTALSEKRTAQEIVEILNEYFTVMVDIIMEEGGVVDKYIGDNIMAVFGAPVTRHDDAVRAVRASVRMREALAKLNERFVQTGRGLPALRFGIGLHTGEVVAGNIGSAKRMEYTVIGDAVNLASRLESKTKELGTDILISEATHAAATGIDAEAGGEIHVKGREQPVQIYKVRGITPRV